MSRRRGNDSDDEGADPPLNHRFGAIEGSSSDQQSVQSSAGSDPGGNWISQPISQQFASNQSASAHNRSNNSQYGAPHDNSFASRSIRATPNNANQHKPKSNQNDQVIRASSLSSRYFSLRESQSTELPSRWVVDASDRALTSVTSLDRTSLTLQYGSDGDNCRVIASPSVPMAVASCVIVSDHSIPLDYLKEIAFGGDMKPGLFGDDPLAETPGTIDQILSNLRSRPFACASTSNIVYPLMNRRATSSSLYPSLPGERVGLDAYGANEKKGNRNLSGSDSKQSYSGNAGSWNDISHKTTSSPVYYFEVVIERMPASAVIAIGMVVIDRPASAVVNTEDGNSDSSAAIPGNIKNSIGLTSKGEVKVSGRTLDDKKFSLESLNAGDVIGCGLEVVGTRRFFFTKNGKTIVSPMRFQDVEPKHSAYAPSVGFVVNGSSKSAVSIYANFGTHSKRTFQWEEAEIAHVVNCSGSAVAKQANRKKLLLSGEKRSESSILFQGDGNRSCAGDASLSPLRPTRKISELQLSYNFGRPSSRNEGLMSSMENMPLFGENGSRHNDNEADWPMIGVPHGELGPLPFHVAAPASKPAPLYGIETPDLRAAPAPASLTNSSSKSESIKRFSLLGRNNNKKPPLDASSLGRNSSSGSTNSREKVSSRSNSPGSILLKAKKRTERQLETLDDETDLSNEANTNPVAGGVLPCYRQTIFVEEALSAPRTAIGIPSTTPPGGVSNAAFLVDQTSGNSRQNSVSCAPMLFGKRSKKSNLDHDNPSDVQLQTAISNDFPLDGIARMPLAPNATANINMSVMAAATEMTPLSGQNNTAQLGTSTLFGKRSKRGTLEDDNDEDRLQSEFANLLNDYESTTAATDWQTSNMAGSNFCETTTNPSRSNGRNLEGDGPNDTRYEMHAQMQVSHGSKNKAKTSLEDDDPDDGKYESHSSLNGSSNFRYGAPSKRGGLEDDTEDDKQRGFSSLSPLAAGSVYHERRMRSDGLYLNASATAAGFSRNVLDGTTMAQNNSENDYSIADFSSLGQSSKERGLDDEEPNDSSYRSHIDVLGSVGHPSNQQNPGIPHCLPLLEPPGPRGSTTVGNSGESSPQRQRETMTQLALATASNGNAPEPVIFDASVFSRNHQEPPNAVCEHSPVRNSLPSLETSAATSARAPAGQSDDDMLNAAIQNSLRIEKVQGQIADGGTLQSLNDIEAIEENTRTLRSSCADESVDANVLETLLELSREDQAKIQACLQGDDPSVDLMQMLELNETVLDAIRMGQSALEGMNKQPALTPPSENAVVKIKASKEGLNVDIGALVEKRDIFSLICILRAQSDQRLDAALALMNFAKEVDSSIAVAGARTLRDDIRSSGGMHSLITVFRSKGASYELRVVAALAVAYVLPSFVESSSVHPSVGLKIMECLRFLSTARLVSPNGRRISREEMYRASAAGVTTFWMNELTPMLNVGAGTPLNGSTVERSDLFGRTNKKGRQRGRTGGQRHQTLELQELLEMTVTLIVQIERLGETEALKKNTSAEIDSLFLWRYTNVEQVCAVDVARPIAVREGLLPILVGWIKSGDREKVRPAVSALRYLTSIKDKYMAGWIHSQMVNEGALVEVVKLADDYYVGQDVRLAVAQILASLCVAPHTRAAVVEANCINYLIGFLYDHSDKASQDVALFAGSAILQLAEGAITRSSVLGGGDTEQQHGASPDKSDTLVNDIVNSGAIGSFIAIALNHEGKLRSMAIEAIRVLSEDTSPNRRTRSQLCEEGAAMSLGGALKEAVASLNSSINPLRPEILNTATSSLDELHDALCGLANILEPIQPGNAAATTRLRFVSSISDPTQNLIQGCIETAESGGLDSLLWISSLPLSGTATLNSEESAVQRIDLLEEACRSLASLSPLLLSKEPAAQGYARCADSIFEAFDRILMLDSIDADINSVASEYNYEQEAMLELNISALRGLGALATAEPLKIKIVDKTLPCLLQMRNSQRNGSEISNAAGQVFLSLGFEEDEIAVQVAGSNPTLLADWFCLQRCLVIQAMARSEVKQMLNHIWKAPFSETKRDSVARLIRESCVRRTSDDEVALESFAESFAEIVLFESFADDDYTEDLRNAMIRQYHEFYNMGKPARSCFSQTENKHDEVSLLVNHMYPLCDTQTEIDWMLSHDESIYSNPIVDGSILTETSLPGHVNDLFDCCFPSRLLRNHVVPVFNFRPEATFDFRALTMPQRKYFSFRREGQLVSRLCDKQAESLDFDDVHWTLGFMNCTFAGEFSETFVQALYLCPTIRGLSFGKSDDYAQLGAVDGDGDRGEDGSTSLANLVGSLPPWIQSLTFSNIFSSREVQTIVGIIETMGKLSSDQAAKASSTGGYSSRCGRDTGSTAQTQGKFWSFAISSSPRVSSGVWYSFFGLLGGGNSLPKKAASTPLSSLKILDLSYNDLGDETSSLLLEMIHDPESGCCLEQLDLSGNRIQQGERVYKVLSRYVEQHRFKIAPDSRVDRSGWKTTLHSLNLSGNSLGMGRAGIAILSLLKHNALNLKLLDLSDNGLGQSVEYELAQELLIVIELNDMLCHLNLSSNDFSRHVLNNMLSQLASYDGESRLAFLGLDNNSTPLSMAQIEWLAAFLRRSRVVVLQECLNERDSLINGEMMQPSKPIDLEMVHKKPTGLSVIGETAILKNQESDFTKNSVFDESDDQPGDNMITVLFSAPLVFTNERRQLKPFAKLDFDMERELMWQCMKEASRDIELFFDNATHDRLLAAITKRCSCLHYSGHGHPSYLPFEDGGGGPNWFKVEDIQRLIAREGAAPFKFVFVSACHSGLAGETFASAGVPHVVCCQQEFELKDTAALAFTRQFYLSLVVGHTVRESFEQGCKAVRATPNLRDSEKEMKKFLLLPKDGNHDVPIFNAKAVVEWPKADARHQNRSRFKRSKSITRLRNLHAGGARSSELGVRNMMQEDPSPTPPQFFLGREVSMYYVLKAILCKRLVSVVAEPGCGRSSLVCALCHYINERASTIIAIEHIYFVKAKRSRRVDGCRALMEQLLRKLVESGKEDPPDPSVDMEDLFDFICKSLKNEKALVVFDRMEYLENSDDAEEFPMLLSTLFRGTKNVKVLVTGRRQLGIPSLGGQVEYPYPLGPLSFENTVRLFANLCPHLHTAGERHKLFERLARDREQSELDPSEAGVSERTREIFKMIGDGIPSRIEQAAYDISADGLRNLLDRYG